MRTHPLCRAPAALALVGVIPGLAWSCKSDPPAAGPVASASATVSASAAPATTTPDDPGGGGDDVKPVYPQTKDPPDPVAQRYCDLVHERPEKRRRECCPSGTYQPFLPTAECVRTLSYALRSKAVTISPAALDACEKAYEEQLGQCDALSTMPAACSGIFEGTVTEGKLCRSALECEGRLFCRGVGPTEPGRCTKPMPDGVPCGGSADALGAFTNQNAYTGHGECEGHCSRRKCEKVVAAGGKCAASSECAPGLRCAGARCTDAALPAAGQACPDKACAEGLQCLAGKCEKPKRIGEECASDQECLSLYCENGAPSKCAPRCQLIRPGAPLPKK